VLSYLAIRNLAIIDKLDVELDRGLTVITGETGAGKSMLLAGLTLLLGGRVDREMLRTGEETLSVEGIWSGPGDRSALAPLLEPGASADETILRRAVSFSAASRRDRLTVADRLVTKGIMEAVAPKLVNISTQHEYISLLSKSEHAAILDRFAGHETLLAEMSQRFLRHQEVDGLVTRLQAESDRRKARLAQLEEILAELDEAAVADGEETELHARIERLTHAVDIARSLASAIDVLYENDGAVLAGLGQAERFLASISRFEPALLPLLERLRASASELDDVVSQVRHLTGRVEVDPALLDHLQGRLALLQKLCRRHAVANASELLVLRLQAAAEMAELQQRDDSLERLVGEREALAAAMGAAAEKLHDSRERASQRLHRAVTEVLAQLDMKKTTLKVAIRYEAGAIREDGGDDVEFLFSANPGEEPRQLRKIASGGELSRVLLAFKAVLAEAYPVPTYLFDEVDSGVGGKTALAVGRLLADLARAHQVICITHTAQLAAYADHHFVASKEEVGGKTFARLRSLPAAGERVQELARMLSGLEDSRTALSHARELLALAQEERKDGGTDRTPPSPRKRGKK
jgi:DNA repair protein RecN (Recombination protein N)